MINGEDFLKNIQTQLEKIGRKDMLTDENIRLIAPIFDSPAKLDFKKAEEWLIRAKEDLEATKILYKKGLYANSTYCLQQSIEKTAKAWCLYYGFIKENDLRNISHITPRAFLKAMRSKHGMIALQFVKTNTTNHNPEIEAFEKLVNTKKDELAIISSEDIDRLIEAVKTIEFATKRELLKFSYIIPKATLLESLKPTIGFIWIYVLSVITFPHYETTRYPTEQEKDTKLKYSLDLGIVKATRKIIPLVAKSIDGLYVQNNSVERLKKQLVLDKK